MDRNYRDALLEKMAEKTYRPLNDEEMAESFQVWGREAADLCNQLEQLYQEGRVFRTKKGKYILPRALDMTVGVLSRHRKGYGFVRPLDEEGTEDVFIPPANLNYAMNGDLVAVKLLSREEEGRRREGAVARILRRGSSEVVGTFYRQKKYGFVTSDDPKQGEDVFVTEKNSMGARTGDKVAVRITVWPQENRSAEGIVTEIVSKKGEPGGDVRALIRARRLKTEFPEEVRREAELASSGGTGGQWEHRRDLRGTATPIITIDGADAKDFDDAVSVKRLDNGNYLLGVHIADVTHYVREGSALDREALKRGTSIYLIDQVIPMLPESLSNGICSLNPQEDRLTLSCDMEIDGQGKIVDHEIYESVIRSAYRMVYGDVSDMLEDPNETGPRTADLKKKYGSLYCQLLLMEELAGILRGARERRGSLDFDLNEAHITLNEEGMPLSVETAERRVANRIIEEFMLAANETVAQHFYWMDAPFVYRIHEKPAIEKMEELRRFLYNFGISLKGNPETVHPKALNEILSQTEGKPEEHVINTVMLRSMKKAYYGTACDGHFGLGVKYYCHFTSPIRRYPDLMIHRIIKEILSLEKEGRCLSQERTLLLKKKTEEAALLSSATERQAQELERDVEKLKMAEYMTRHIGEIHTGVVSGVASFGFFVELENTVEGVVRVAELTDDYYEYEPERYRLIGRRSHKIYGLGQKVIVCVAAVDVANREIYFTISQADRQDLDSQSASVSGRRIGQSSRRAEKKRKKGRDEEIWM